MIAEHHVARRAGLLAAALVAALVLSSAPAAAQETEQIHNYGVQIAVESTGDIFVTEVIDYDFGSNERHGIFREIPVRFHYDDRYDRVYPIEVLSVKGSLNTPDQFEEEREGNLLRIRIGDPDRTITGRHTYAIVYRVEGALNGFRDHNELYWNAIGDEWDVPIDNGSVAVTTIGITEVACFTGPDFSTLPCTSSKVEDPTATFTQSGLAPFENLTVGGGFSHRPDPRSPPHPQGAVELCPSVLVHTCDGWSGGRASLPRADCGRPPPVDQGARSSRRRFPGGHRLWDDSGRRAAGPSARGRDLSRGVCRAGRDPARTGRRAC